jgi:hypothetical protein
MGVHKMKKINVIIIAIISGIIAFYAYIYNNAVIFLIALAASYISVLLLSINKFRTYNKIYLNGERKKAYLTKCEYIPTNYKTELSSGKRYDLFVCLEGEDITRQNQLLGIFYKLPCELDQELEVLVLGDSESKKIILPQEEYKDEYFSHILLDSAKILVAYFLAGVFGSSFIK